jgi:hypothetical protein
MAINIIFHSDKIPKVSKIKPIFRSARTSVEFDKNVEFDEYYKDLYPRTSILLNTSKSPRSLE